MSFSWPAILKARRSNPHLRGALRSGGRSISGIEQRVASDAGYFEVVYDGIRIRNLKEATAYRAMIARLRHGESILLAICDRYLPTGARSGNAAIVVQANAPLRATQVTLTVTNVDVKLGHYISVGDRLHVITEIVSGPTAPPMLNPIATDAAFVDEPWTDSVSGSANYTVKLLPPLRSAVPAGTAATFRDLTLRCVIKDAGDGDLDLDLGRFGAPSLTFIEDF